MKTELFEELQESTREALAHARGKLDLRTTGLPPAPRPMSGEQGTTLEAEPAEE